MRKKDDNYLFSHEIENARLIKECIASGDSDKEMTFVLQWQE